MGRAKEKEIRPIPFGKAARVGNFKIWRSSFLHVEEPTEEQRQKVREESGGRRRAVNRKTSVECINVSTLSGFWSVKIPQFYSMFGTITVAYGEGDERGEEFLKMLFGNMLTVSTLNNEYVHDAFMFLLEMMKTPYLLLSEKEMEKRMRKGFEESGIKDKEKCDSYIDNMRKYRAKLYKLIEEKKAAFIKDYELMLRKQREKEEAHLEESEHMEIAEQAESILSKDIENEEGGES